MATSPNRRQRIIEYATPKISDLVVVELVDCSKNNASLKAADDNTYGSFHPDKKKFPNFKLSLIKNADDKQGQFQNWYYIKDPTHVVFYNKKTFQIIAKIFDWDSEFLGNNLVFLKKN